MRIRKSGESSFFDMFTDQAQHLVTGVGLLASILEAAPDQRGDLRKQLHEVENQGDEINHAITQRINQSFVTPFDRSDLGLLASELDDCMDLIDEAGDFIVLYDIGQIPEDVATLLTEQVDVLTRCAEQTARAMPGLKDPAGLRDYWVEINRLENEGDRAFRHTLTTLFNSGMDPITIIKLKDVIEVLERCADAFENLANTVETIAVKES
ncbi:DUF47 family protein [Schaalia sp. 19OD2882]|uniref:DUF47 domain-containing protein n=1 Tax=Schaalia sp. 19OD2882 TaxID=2794089 RepID=UPI001C1F1C19|nr:DUF47 family protein [Schaalia sp. 19OD2882]QWW19388.1 DUF47 family protein [Schaalia sp. 19OD2882]